MRLHLTALAFVVACSAALALGTVACDGEETGAGCNHDGVCDAQEDSAHCADDCPVCNHDFYCDVASGENVANCTGDCSGHCSGVPMTGASYDFIVESVYFPDTVETSMANGIDIDGDGTIDNKLGEILQFLTQDSTDYDISAAFNKEIAEGDLIMLGRIRESGRSDDFVHVQLTQGTLNGSTPVFDGQDQVILDPNASHSLFLCGEWAAPRLETSPANLTWTFEFPEIGTLQLTLSSAQVRTVSDPDHELFGSSAITPNGWTNVMVGGGLSEGEIDHSLIPFIVTFLNAMVSETGDNDLLDFIDGNCVVVDGVPACEDVVAGEGECSNLADPPFITATEVRCNADIYWMFLPDVDSDGDGEPDLLSFGYRVVSAVPVTIVEP